MFQDLHFGSSPKSLLFISFSLVSILSIASVLAAECKSYPIIYNEHGVPLLPNGGSGLYINGSAYSEMLIDYEISAKNKNDQGITVVFRPMSGLGDYISDTVVHIPANTVSPVSLSTWVGGQSYQGVIEVEWSCDDGKPGIYSPIVIVVISGQKLEPPPFASCDSHGLDGCYSGMRRNYYCSHGVLEYSESCTDSCCENYGGIGSFCSEDNTMCYTWDTLPPGTEGEIAFICKDEDCDSNTERQMMFMLRKQGWNVDARPQEEWNWWDFEDIDIIACRDQRNACKIDFNSVIYDQHKDKRIGFLEITDNRKASAADSFGYITSNRAGTGKDEPYFYTSDYITDGYSGYVPLVQNAYRYVAIDDKYLCSEAIDLADSGNEEDSSLMFKVKEDMGNGRYAFIGWMYDSMKTTSDADTILSRTLYWLAHGDEYFGGANNDPAYKGKIAVLCSSDDCKKDNEEGMIKYLRNNGYSVKGQDAGSWSFAEFRAYDLIVCTDPKSCDLEENVDVYNSHMYDQKPFLDIPYRGGLENAEVFGYVGYRSRSDRDKGYAIIPQGEDIIFDGFDGYMEIFKDKESIYGASLEDLHAVSNLAMDTGHEMSTMFVSTDNFERGKYAFVGWITKLEELNEDGNRLFIRTIDWLICGDACIDGFAADFGDMQLEYEIHTPEGGGIYNETRMYLNITSNQRFSEVSYSINDGRTKTVCRRGCDPDDLYKRMRVEENENVLHVTMIDYTGAVHEEYLEFFVDSREPRIRGLDPRRGDLAPLQNFKIKYYEDNLVSVKLHYGTELDWRTYDYVGCESGSPAYCDAIVDLSGFIGQEIHYQVELEDVANIEQTNRYHGDVVPVV